MTQVNDINTSSTGLIRIKKTKCLNVNDGTEITNCIGLSPGDEEIQYVYDETMSVVNFLRKSDPYLIIYNSKTAVVPINISSKTPFSLPQSEITTKALK